MGVTNGSNGRSPERKDIEKKSFFRRGKKKTERLNIRLEFERKVLYEISDPSPTDAITIGRSSECTWVIPREDGVASGHHAVILTRNGRLCLRDTGSRNGIFYKAKKIQEKYLAPDDQFSIGNCTLIVERIRSVRTISHELMFLNTDRKGESVKLDKEKILVGSAPGCDLVIGEQLVSQKHAEFSSKADGCWLKDLGSKNGTFVNGTKLSPATERLLADDDVVSISFVDFKFVDGRVEHSKVRIWYSLGIVAVTIFVALALNWVWRGVKPSSDDCLETARNEASAARFDRAREALKESRTRRGAETGEVAYNELESSLAMWEKIYAGWGKAKSALKSGNWIEASHQLGMITDGDPNLWGWNDTTAPVMRQEAFTAKKLLDTCLRAETVIRDDRNRKNLAELKQAADTIREMEKDFAGAPPDYLEKLLAEGLRLRGQIEENLQYLERLDAILARIESESDNLAVVLSDLEELKQNAEPNIRIRIENCMVPLAMLQRSGKEIRRAALKVQRLDFPKPETVRLDLPTLEQCIVNKNIATLRKEQERQFHYVLSVASGIQPMIRELEECGLTADTPVPDCVKVFQDPEVMAKVFACDSFESKMPSRLRTAPSGEYDRVLGIEGFFEFMYSLPAPYDPSTYAEFQFRPEIIRFRRLLAAIRTFRTFADQEQNAWLHSGAFLELYENTGEILKIRDGLAAGFRQTRADAPSRERILRSALAIFLDEEGTSDEQREAFVREFKMYRLPLIQLNREYNTAADERKIEIRESILKQGLPGDPVSRRMWGFRKYPR